MKKNYILLILLISTFVAKSQVIPQQNERYKLSYEEVMSLKKQHSSAADRAQSFYMDHSLANNDDGFFIWRFSSSYSNVDTALNFVGLSLSKIAGYTDPTDPAGSICDSSTFGFTSSYPLNIGISIDSIFAMVTHENNSGTYNRITMQIVQLNAQGAPSNPTGVSTVLWQQIDSTNVSLSSSGNWLGSGAATVLSYTPLSGFLGASPGTKLGLVLQYNDATKLDSFGVSAGYAIDPNNQNYALQSTIPTSFMRYPPYIPSVSRNSMIGYGNPPGSTGWFQAQNWGMWAHVTVGTDVLGYGLNKQNGFRILESFPNPTNNISNVRFEIGKVSDVSIVVTNINGEIVKELQTKNNPAGIHVISLGTDNLNNGIYTYNLYANNASISKKFIVSH